MKFSFTAEQDEFRSVLRRYFEDRAPTIEVRRLMATEIGWDREQWRRMNNELGLAAIAIPEACGGQGFGAIEQCIVMEEMGRALLCAPYLSSTVLAATAIQHGGRDNQKHELLPAIASGNIVATLAMSEDNGDWTLDGTATTATDTGAGFVLDGAKTVVPDGHTADLIIVCARRPGTSGSDGLSLFIVDSDADGLDRKPLATIDETRKLARLTFSKTPAAMLGHAGTAPDVLRHTQNRASICLANEMVGGAERLREDALEYTRMRIQFGRSIASFQVIKHKAADMLADVELAKSAAYYAAAAIDERGFDDAAMPAIASLAKAAASEAYMQTAVHAIQMHGGIGFTWDNDTHLWFKRAKSSEVFLGDANYHRERMMQHLDHWQEGDQ